MIRLADKPIDDREVETWFDFAGQDGGLWQMAINLVKNMVLFHHMQCQKMQLQIILVL